MGLRALRPLDRFACGVDEPLPVSFDVGNPFEYFMSIAAPVAAQLAKGPDQAERHEMQKGYEGPLLETAERTNSPEDAMTEIGRAHV